MADITRSAQSDALDSLVWSRLSPFWTRDYSPDDREALNAVYEGALHVLDAEYVHLLETNKCKGIESAPIHTQKRWLRLDLNREAELAAFMSFISRTSVTSTSSTAGSSASGIDCATSSSHPRHWHLTFPVTIPSGDRESRSTIDLAYPTELSLVDIFHIRMDTTTGRKQGIKLKPSVDYSVLPNNTSIRIASTLPGEQYEITAALNFTSTQFDGLNPLVAYAPGYDRVAANVVLVPPSLSATNLPIHVLVVRNVVDVGNGGLLQTNTPAFDTTYEFYPWTGDARGPRHGAALGQVALPPTVELGATDAVFVFGLTAETWDIAHRHNTVTAYLNQAAIPGSGGSSAAGTTDVVFFDSTIQPGLFGSLGYLGHVAQVYMNGALLHTSEYSLSGTELKLRTPVSWRSNEYVRFDVRTTTEYSTLQQALGDQHIHYTCQVAVANPPSIFGTLDDGGELDDEDGFFDDSEPINVIYIADSLVDLASLEVYVNGTLLVRDLEYTASYDRASQRTRLAFAQSIRGKSVIAVYRRDTRTHTYGDYLSPTRTLLSSLSGLLTDVRSIVSEFSSTHALSPLATRRLIEAAQIAASGGNPFLTLFFDEYAEYEDLPIEAEGQTISSANARDLESAGTQLISIPFLVDHVLNPSVRLQEGVDYDIVDGKLLSSTNLTNARNAGDSTPGVWWCPVAFFDEQVLAKNFGSVVGDVRASSESNKQQLKANIDLRFHGPVIKNLLRDFATMLGSPTYSHDGVVLSVSEEVVGYNVTVGNATAQQVEFVSSTVEPLPVGTTIVPTQSLTIPPLFDGKLVNLVQSDNSRLVIRESIRDVEPGDVVRMTIVNPADTSQTELTFTSTVKSYSVNLDSIFATTVIILHDVPRFTPTTSSHLTILKQSGPPYASIAGTVLNVEPVKQTVVRTDSESITLNLGAYPEQVVGERVERGQPLFPSVVSLYDSISRPNWHKLLPAAADSQLTATRAAVLRAPTAPGRYSVCELTPLFSGYKRGDVLSFTDSATSDVLPFTVIGQHQSGVVVSPTVSTTKTGIIELTSAKAATKFFEFPAPANAPTTTLTVAQVIRSKSLSVTSTATFPAAGRVAILLATGGYMEFEYRAKSDSSFIDCTWEGSFPALTQKRTATTQPGILNPLIPVTATLRLISEYATTTINPAFAALVKSRTDTTSAPFALTNDNVETLYDMLKTNAAVLESKSAIRPAVITDAVQNLLPTSTTVIAISRLVVSDTYTARASDVIDLYPVMSVNITNPQTGTEVSLASGTTSVLLTSIINDPEAASPYIYRWEQYPTVDALATFSTPAAATTTFNNLANGKTYFVRLTVTNSALHDASYVFTVRVASA